MEAKKVILAAAVMLCATTVSAGDKSPGANDDLVRRLGKNGDICRAYGHKWAEPNPLFTYAVYCPGGPAHRVCSICGKEQIQEPTRWRDE